ncbi:MAG TPA: translocation/assembly module TamB domain-containing protein, partial [Terriglobales bacterium]|nr:translocation/assembly module TamB domain-containing protein [Terriglobales bacterium]
MRSKSQKPGRRERKLVQLGAGVLLLALVITTGWYLTSRRFENWVRLKVIAELQDITGGRVELGSLHWQFSRLEIDIHDLTIHGLEPAGELPYAHVDHLLVHLKILSLFAGDFGLRTLVAERPVIHIMVGPAGATNQPMPIVVEKTQPTSMLRLFDLGVEHAEISSGELIWNDQHIPLNLEAEDVAAKLMYVPATRRFDGSAKIGKLESYIQELRPFSSSIEAEFSLSTTAADVASLRWQSEGSTLNFKGRMPDLSTLRLEGSYDLLLDLHQVGEVTRTPELRAGTLRMIGLGTFSPEEVSSRGKMFLRKAEWASPTLHTTALNLSADFSADKTRWQLSRIAGNGFGGAFSGEGTWTGWMNAIQANINPKDNLASKLQSQAKTRVKTQDDKTAKNKISKNKTEAQSGALHLHLRGLQASEVAKAVSTRTLPFDRLHLSGQVGGDVDLKWKGSLGSLQSTLALIATPPAESAPNALPLQGEFRGTYQRAGNRLDIADANLATRSTTVSASGILASTNSMLNLNLKSASASELQPLLSAWDVSNFPLELHGPASFLGMITGKLSAPAVNGHVELTDFYSQFSPAASPKRPNLLQAVTQKSPQSFQRMHWEKFSADMHLDPNSLAIRDGLLTREKAQIHLRLSSALHKYQLADSSQFSATVAVRGASLEDLQNLAGVNYPLTGTVNLDLEASGTRFDPRGEGSFELLQGTVMGRPFKSLRSKIRLSQQEAQFNDFVFALNGARMTGTASYNFVNDGTRFEVTGENFDLGHIPALASERLSIQGTATFEASGSGTLSEPVLNARATLHNLVLNGERQGDLNVEAATQGADLRLKAYSKLEDATLQLDGSVHLRGSWPADITLNVRDLDFDPLLHAYLQGHITGHSSAAGTLHLQGPLRDLKQVNLAGDFPQLSADIENVKLRNEGPIRFSAAQGLLHLEQVHIVGEGTDFSAQGSVPFSMQQPVNVSVNGNINLRVLQGYYPGLQSSGATVVAMKIEGTLDQPSVIGQVQISNAGISLIDLPNGLSEMNGTLVFNQNRLQIQSLTARTGGGDLKLGGFIAYSRGIYFDMAASGNGIRLRYPPGVSAEASAELHFVGTPQNSTLSGEITVNKFSLTPSFDFGSYLVSSKRLAFTSSADSPLSNVHFALHVITRPELQVQSSLAKVTGDADLNLRGTAARPVVLGRVNISSGDIFFNGTKYHLERGDVLFINPLAIIPILDMEATTRVRDYDITLGFHGPIDRLTASYRSDPPLPTADIIALL